MCRSDAPSSRFARSPQIQWLVALVPPATEPDCQPLQNETASVDARLAIEPDTSALRASKRQSVRGDDR
ncbi:hypothetical protein [Lysobacter sp. F60174L2]|uniref:hypothetical protein n=1 Tax=Lysobacter sp. F60174L2 TaxID=3459295 RepID=UPI00403DF13E